MFEKANKFYADWRDSKGKRKRKSFVSMKAAQKYEEEQKAITHPKKTAQVKQLPTYSVPERRRQPKKGKAATAQTRQQPAKHSLKRQANSRRAK